MSAPLEAFLAKLYSDKNARASFLANPREEALKAGLAAHEVEALVKIDRIGLELFSKSLELRRQRTPKKLSR